MLALGSKHSELVLETRVSNDRDHFIIEIEN